mgnify:CR=1 FL=1
MGNETESQVFLVLRRVIYTVLHNTVGIIIVTVFAQVDEKIEYSESRDVVVIYGADGSFLADDYSKVKNYHTIDSPDHRLQLSIALAVIISTLNLHCCTSSHYHCCASSIVHSHILVNISTS